MTAATFTDQDQLGFLLGRAYYTYIGFLTQVLHEAGLDEHCKPGMGSVLFALFNADDRPMMEIAEELQLAKSTMSGMIAVMKRGGLVTLKRDRRDGRTQRVCLTPVARAIEGRCRNLAVEVEERLCRNLSPAQRNSLKKLMGIVIETIAADMNGSKGLGKSRLTERSKA